MRSRQGRFSILTAFLTLISVLGQLDPAWSGSGDSTDAGQAAAVSDFCSYNIAQREELRASILAGFPAGMSEEDARRLVAEYVPSAGIRETRLPQKGPDGKLLYRNGDVVFSDARLLGTRVVCELPSGNRNIWSIYLLVDEEKRLADADFYVAIDDENFAERGIPLLAEYVYGEDTIAKAIDSLARERFKTWPDLKAHILEGGFEVPEGTRVAKRTSYPSRLWFRFIGADGISASVVYDTDGKYLETE